MMYNPSKSTWMNPNIEYLFNEDIIEYDMTDAGFSLVKQYQLLPPETIKSLELLPKGLERHIAIGKIQGIDKEFNRALLDKFAEIREVFIKTNKLSDDSIISVKKDAIFTIGECKRVKFGTITFSRKNMYSSYIRFPNIQNLEIYYSDRKMDIKGMNDSSVNRHRLFMYDFLRRLIPLIESRDSKVRRDLMRFIERYKSHDLDEEYYVEFNNLSRDMNPIFNYQNILVPLVQIILKEVP